jgi:hypothetical protein
MSASQNDNWVHLYTSAILETDETKLLERVALAKQAIQKRHQELSSSSTGYHDERQKLDDAANMLGMFDRRGENRHSAPSDSRRPFSDSSV